MRSVDELLDAYEQAYESVGGHPNRGARGLGIAAVLDLVAEDIDAGPSFPLPPSVISELVREKAAAIRAAFPSAGVDRDGPD